MTTRIVQKEADVSDLPRETPLAKPSLIKAVFGSSLLWAWGFLCYLSPIMFPPTANTEASVGIEFGFFASQASVVVFVAILLAASRKTRIALSGTGIFFAALGLSITSGALAFFVYAQCIPGVIACGIADGVCATCLGIAWGARYSLGSKRMRLLVLFSFLIAYFLYLAIPLLPKPASAAFVVLMPLGSWLLWRSEAAARNEIAAEPFVKKGSHEESVSEIVAGIWEASALPWKSLGVLVVASFIGNLIASIIMGDSYTGAESLFRGGVLVCACIATMSLAIVSSNQDTLRISAIYRVTVTFSATGLVCILVFDSSAVPLGAACIQGGALFLQALCILAVTQSTQEQGLSPVLSFGIGQALVSCVVLAGNLVGKVLCSWQFSGPDTLSIVCGTGLLILFFMLAARDESAKSAFGRDENHASAFDENPCFMLNKDVAAGTGAPRITAPTESETGSSTKALPENDRALEDFYNQKIKHFAETFALTKRETEVFAYLARGRSLPYIAEELFVTTGTVKTHTMHIYRKLGINSKQELMDALESFEQPHFKKEG